MEAPASRAAPYGQACVHCVKAKCRCIIQADGNCERCSRLSKDCKTSTPARRKGAARNNTSRRTELEDKLEDLVSLLREQNARPSAQATTTNSASLPTPQSSNTSPAADVEIAVESQLTDQDLVQFRERHLSYFPFMHLPESTTAEELQLDKPMLSQAIHTVCTKAASKQRVLSRRLREQIAYKIVANGERNLDILLSTLVCLTWPIYITHGKQFLGSMSSMAKIVTSDLRLDRAQHPAGCPSIGPLADTKADQSSASKRALVSVFALSTVISSIFKYDSMSWSTCIEDACQWLTNEKETESDWIIVAACRLAKITSEASEVSRRATEDSGFAKHIVLAIDPLKASLEIWKKSCTSDQLQNSTIRSFIVLAEITINEICLMHPPPTTYNSSIDYKRIECLTACLHVCKSYTDEFIAADLTRLEVFGMSLYGYCVKIIFLLSTLQDPGWSTSLVRSTVDTIYCLEQGAAAAARGNLKFRAETGEDSILAQSCELMKGMRHLWKVPDQEVLATDEMSLATGWIGDNLDLPMIDFTDDFWLSARLDI